MKSSEISIAENLTKNNFFRALLILIQKPQVINRKLSCSVNKKFIRVNVKKDEFLKIVSIDEIKSSGEDLKTLFDGKLNYEEAKLEDLEHANELENVTFISLNKILPRNGIKHQPCYSIAIIGELLMFKIKKSSNLIIYKFFRLHKSISILLLMRSIIKTHHIRALSFHAY
jgi:hypothetical protein